MCSLEYQLLMTTSLFSGQPLVITLVVSCEKTMKSKILCFMVDKGWATVYLCCFVFYTLHNSIIIQLLCSEVSHSFMCVKCLVGQHFSVDCRTQLYSWATAEHYAGKSNPETQQRANFDDVEKDLLDFGGFFNWNKILPILCLRGQQHRIGKALQRPYQCSLNKT